MDFKGERGGRNGAWIDMFLSIELRHLLKSTYEGACEKLIVHLKIYRLM